MESYRIPESYIASISRRRKVAVFFIVTAAVFIFEVWSGNAISLKSASIALVIGFIAALQLGPVGNSPVFPWANLLFEESQWVLVPSKDGLEFHRDGGVSEIKGKDIKKIIIKYRHGRLMWFHIYYLDQNTRIRHYEGMESLLAHVRKIAGDDALIEELKG